MLRFLHLGLVVAWHGRPSFILFAHKASFPDAASHPEQTAPKVLLQGTLYPNSLLQGAHESLARIQHLSGTILQEF